MDDERLMSGSWYHGGINVKATFCITGEEGSKAARAAHHFLLPAT
jgi:hypothetical protein